MQTICGKSSAFDLAQFALRLVRKHGGSPRRTASKSLYRSLKNTSMQLIDTRNILTSEKRPGTFPNGVLRLMRRLEILILVLGVVLPLLFGVFLFWKLTSG
jgi:hypothetical protein